MSIFPFLSDSILKRKKKKKNTWPSLIENLVSPATIHDSSFTQDVVRIVEEG